METGKYFLYFFCAYLVGSFPTGTIASRLKGGESVIIPGERTTKSVGDVFNILGMKLGLLVTAIDVLKGWIVVFPLISLIIGPDGHFSWWIVSLGGLLVVIGHCNSAFLGFKGGRGLATTFGVLITILPVPALISCLIWASLSFWGLSTKPGALSAAGAMPVISVPWVWWFQRERLFYLFVVAFLSLWTLWEHRESLMSYMGITAPPPNSLPPEQKPADSLENFKS